MYLRKSYADTLDWPFFMPELFVSAQSDKAKPTHSREDTKEKIKEWF
jgi:hypothetical protein